MMIGEGISLELTMFYLLEKNWTYIGNDFPMNILLHRTVYGSSANTIPQTNLPIFRACYVLSENTSVTLITSHSLTLLKDSEKPEICK
jgi:hypothetical protein